MGLVCLAEQETPIKRRVALKLIKLGMDTRAVVSRFESERQALALMDHPNIAKVHDAGAAEDGRPYFVMEYVEGVPITDYCDRHRLDTAARLTLFMDVCRGVQHAHQKGIIHRDLKPSNILITVVDDKPVPKIIDFGIAKATNHKLTEMTLSTELGEIVGTPEYISPEQADPGSMNIDTRTDIYSLGVLLYEILVGVLPLEAVSFSHAWAEDMRRMIRDQEPQKPSSRLMKNRDEARSVAHRRRSDIRSLTRQIRGDLDWITLKTLQKEPMRRYASVSELEADIDRFLNHEPVSASPPSAVYRLTKFIRKNRGAAVAVLAVMIVLAGGLLASTLLYLQSESRQRDALCRIDLQQVEKLRHEAEWDLWPAAPFMVPQMETWIRKARALLDRLPYHASTLETLQAHSSNGIDGKQKTNAEILYQRQVHSGDLLLLAMKRSDLVALEAREPSDSILDRITKIRKEIHQIEERIDAFSSSTKRAGSLVFTDEPSRERYEVLVLLVEELRKLQLDDPNLSMLRAMQDRLDLARHRVEEASVSSPEAARAWDRAVARYQTFRHLRLRDEASAGPLAARQEPTGFLGILACSVR